MIREELQKADDKSFKEYVQEEMRYIHILMDDFGMERKEAIEFMKYLEIKEIGGAIYGNGETISIRESLADLAACVGETGKSSYLCIAGEVMNYQP